MKELKYKELMILNALINEKNFSSVADHYGISQSALSKMASSIEKKLGSSILNRDHRPLKITAFGNAITPYLNACINKLDAFEKSITHFQENGSGHVTLYASGAIQSILVKFILPRVNANHPDIKIALKTKPQLKNEYVHGIYFEDDCDILVSYNIPKNQNLIAKKITTVNLNIFSTDDFYQKHPFNQLAELHHHPFILQNYLTNQHFNNVINVLDTHTNTTTALEMNGHYMFDNNQQAVQYSAQGIGYVLSSHLSTTEYPHLKPRLPQNFIIPLGIYVIYREKMHQTSQVKKIYHDIIAGLNELQWQD